MNNSNNNHQKKTNKSNRQVAYLNRMNELPDGTTQIRYFLEKTRKYISINFKLTMEKNEFFKKVLFIKDPNLGWILDPSKNVSKKKRTKKVERFNFIK